MIPKDARYYNGFLSMTERVLQGLRDDAESDDYWWLVEDLDPALKAVRHAIEEIARDDPYDGVCFPGAK